ncbi:MAG: diaminopimelate decarboxylase [Chloroflexi bacterium]|nr:diaminopimelate decarboxylase [Chloroflexota bacterium]
MTLSVSARVLPLSAGLSSNGHLAIGGCDTVALAAEFGTPLYVYDELTIRTRCREYRAAIQSVQPDALVLYASKAFSSRMVLQIANEEGLGLDVVSGGELFMAQSVDFPSERIYFHGNNKSPDELRMALETGVGRIVVDSFYELELLDRLANERGLRQPILLRLSPGVEAHTHDFRKTGILDSKFGFPISTGQAREAVERAVRGDGLELLGYHCHIGSQIFELEPYIEATEIAFSFARSMRDEFGVEPREYSPGGGWGVAYTDVDDPWPIPEIVAQVGEGIGQLGARFDLGQPRMVIEPGRSIVGQAGVALYTVGAIKKIPDLRTYVSVDGGMADNIRPAIYGAAYEAIVANRPEADRTEVVTVAGKYCESGDLLIKDIDLPPLVSGDILALPTSGAYNLAMSSNYNQALKPAVVLVRDGQARLMRRRQTFDDLLIGEECF